MALDQKTKRRIVANGFAVLAAALVMWLYTSKHKEKASIPSTNDSIIKIAIDLSPNGLQIDSLGNLSGKQKELLDLLLPDYEKEIKPFTSRVEALAALSSGEVQLYATSMPFSSANDLKDITATEWLYASHFSLLYHEKDAQWSSRFSGDSTSTVVVSKEDQAAITILENLSELAYPSLKVEMRDESPVQLGVELSKGNISYLMCDSDIAESIIKVDSTLQLSHDVGFDLHQVWLVNSKQDSLRVALDSAIIALRDKEEWLKIINNKY